MRGPLMSFGGCCFMFTSKAFLDFAQDGYYIYIYISYYHLSPLCFLACSGHCWVNFSRSSVVFIESEVGDIKFDPFLFPMRFP